MKKNPEDRMPKGEDIDGRREGESSLNNVRLHDGCQRTRERMSAGEGGERLYVQSGISDLGNVREDVAPAEGRRVNRCRDRVSFLVTHHCGLDEGCISFALFVQSSGGDPCTLRPPSQPQASHGSQAQIEPRILHLRFCLVDTRPQPGAPLRDPTCMRH